MDEFLSELLGNWNTNLETLAQTKADCDYYRYTKKCNPEECKNCSTGAKLSACYSRLALCDQLKVDQIAKKKTGWKLYDYKRELKSKRNIKIAIGILIGMFMPVILAILCGANPETILVVIFASVTIGLPLMAPFLN